MSTLSSLVFLVWSASAAESWSDEAAAALSQPRDASALRALASALGDDPATVQDAAVGFRGLIGSQRPSGPLLDGLVRLVLSHPVQPGWRDLYLTAAGAVSDEDERTALKLRAADAAVLAGDGATGLKEAKAVVGAAREDAAIVLAHAALAQGDAKAALAALEGRARTREARELLALSVVALGVAQEPAWWLARLQQAGWSDVEVGKVAESDRALAYVVGLSGEVSGPRTWLAPGEESALLAGLKATDRATRARALLAWGLEKPALNVLGGADPDGPAATEIAQARQLRARVKLRAGDAKGALADLDAALALLPDEPSVLTDRALALSALGRHDEAVTAAGVDPKVGPLVAARKALAAAEATPDKADDEAALVALLGADPLDRGASRRLGLLRAADKRYAEALDPLEAALRARASDAEVAATLVTAAIEAKAADRALAAARLALGQARSAGDRKGLGGSLQYAWIKRAEERRNARDIEAVADAYGVSHLLAPSDLGVYRALAGAWWGAGQLDQAWNTYLTVFELDHKDADGLSALAALAVQMGREGELKERLAPYADDADVRKVLRELEIRSALAAADATLRKGDVQGAYDQYLRLQARDPNNADVVRGFASVRLAQGDVDGALDLFRQARLLDGDSPWSRIGEANALLTAGELERAEQILDELAGTPDASLAREVDRARVRVLVARAAALREAGDDDAAFEALATAHGYGPDTWVCHNVARLYQSRRQYDLARAFYDEAYELDTNNVYARLGEASLLVELGWLEEAEATLDTLPADNADVIAARNALQVARAVREADVARRIGETEEARLILQKVYEQYPDDPAARAMWATEVLDGDDPAEVLAAARAFLIKDPLDELALGAALRSAHKLGTTEQILPLFEAAAAKGTAVHGRWLGRARIAAASDKAVVLHEAGRHEDAVGQLQAQEERVGDDASAWSILAGAWLDLREARRAIEAFDKALALAPGDAGALIGKAGALTAQGKSRDGIALLEAAWAEGRDPEIGVALAEAYRGARRLKDVDRVLSEIEGLDPVAKPTAPLRALPLYSGREVAPIEPAPRPRVLGPSLEGRRRELRESSPKGGWLPGFDLGVGVYSRPGYAGQQFLTAFFTPIRLHELRAGPVAFDVEAVPYFLSDFEDEQYGAMVSAGLQAGAGPVGMHFRGGASPLGFSSRPYFIWYGNVDVRASDQVALGVLTSREPVTDSLTSWAGKLDRRGETFGRVHRTGIGGYLNVTPSEADKLSLFGRGGWNQGLQMERVVAFWEAAFSGAHDFTFGLFDLRVGGLVLGMAFSDQVDKFRPGEGGFFSPELFVMGAGKFEARVHTRNEKLRACAGANLGAQYIQADYVEGTDDYIRPGVFFGYSVSASLDWRMARYWWLGVDYGRTVTGTTWRQDIAMLHLHFGPSDAWERARYPVYSPLAGQPVIQSQPCGH